MDDYDDDRAIYTKLRGGSWGVAVFGEPVEPGDTVIVTARSGRRSQETIAEVLHYGDGVQICSIDPDATFPRRPRRMANGWNGRRTAIRAAPQYYDRGDEWDRSNAEFEKPCPDCRRTAIRTALQYRDRGDGWDQFNAEFEKPRYGRGGE